MKVREIATAPFITCPDCRKRVFYWKYGGMSNLWPHFYCDKCSNVFWSSSARTKYLAGDGFSGIKLDAKFLKDVEASLPNCNCGGQYVPGANPKCFNCGHEFKHQDGPSERLGDPYLVLLDGACFHTDDPSIESYQLKIMQQHFELNEMKNTKSIGHVEISFAFARNMGCRYVHGAVTLQFAPKEYSFRSQVNWPKDDNYEEAIRVTVEETLRSVQGHLNSPSVLLKGIEWDEVSSCQTGFERAARAATLAAFEV